MSELERHTSQRCRAQQHVQSAPVTQNEDLVLYLAQHAQEDVESYLFSGGLRP